MKRTLLFVPVLLIAIAVGVILYSGVVEVDDVTVEGGLKWLDPTTLAAAQEYGLPDDIFYTEPVEAVVFSHATHAGDVEFSCSTCHDGLFEMEAKSVQSQPDFNMAGLAEGKYCGTCHSSSNEVAFASDTQCARCHVGVTGLERAVSGNS
jgi:c(7)-type cytochrome triheme protein